MVKMKIWLTALTTVISCSISFAQTTNYYRLVKTVIGGTTSTNVSGGQFITFNDKLCYESDNKGNQVNESRMDHKYTSDGIKVYSGMSYWGTNTTFFIPADNSKLSVRTSGGDKYVYERCAAPAGVSKSSLIRQRESSVIYTPQPVYPVGGGYSGGSGNSSSSTSSGSSSRPQYTKTCGVCHGTGTCNICGGKGWVTRMGMGKDGPCSVCPNHNGRCSSCGGRGTWKE